MSAPMPDRERLETLMLEHAYGLLDGDDLAELNAFLATPEGAELARDGDRWKARLAGAAKDAHPAVAFQVPESAPAAAAKPASPASPLAAGPTVSPAPAREAPRPTRASIGRRWALAASVLVVACVCLPFGLQGAGWLVARSEVSRYEREVRASEILVAEAKRSAINRQKEMEDAVVAAGAARDQSATKLQESLAAVRKTIDQKDFAIRLTGPSRVQPGAPNEWRVETLNKNGGYTLPKKMELVMRDQNNRELLHETYDKPQAPSTLKLPASFWEKVKPDSELFLEVVAYNEDDRRSVLAERVPLAGPVYVTQIATDKPLYKPGEVVHFRSLTLDRATFLPPDHDMRLKFRLRDPSSAVVELESGNGRVMEGHKPLLGPDRKPVRGLGIGDYELPETAPGGEYELQVFETNEQNGIETLLDTRKFIVNTYVVEEFQKKLEFDGKSYGAGEWVQARVEASRTAGGPLKDSRASVVASIEGVPFHQENNVRFNSKGVLNLRFKLPGNVGNGNASLSVTIVDGGQPETIVRPIPVIGKQLNVEFYPEGGDLIEGVPCRVYVQVRTPLGKPADLKGRITDGKDKVADFATLTDAENPGVNRGQGTFVFTPQAGKSYFLQVETPTSIEPPSREGFPLPKAKADGVVLTSVDPVTPRGEPIRMRVQVGKGSKVLHVGAYARGRLIQHRRVEVAAGKAAEFQLQGDDKLGGVTRVTVFEEPANEGAGRANLIPRAERLVYRKPAEELRLGVSPSKNRFSPADKVSLELSSLNEKDAAAAAVLMVAVVNQSVITMADNKTDRLMPTHFLIAGDVKNPAELEHADFLLTEHPKAGVALDLLLGTQGWRRFAEQNLPTAKPDDQVEVNRMLVSTGQRSTAPIDVYRSAEQQVRNEIQPLVEELTLKAQEADEKLTDFQSTQLPELNQNVQRAQNEKSQQDQRLGAARGEFQRLNEKLDGARAVALPVIIVGLLLAAIVNLVLSGSLARTNRTKTRKWAMWSVGSAVVFMAVLFATNDPKEGSAFAWLGFGSNANTTFSAIGAKVGASLEGEPLMAPGRPMMKGLEPKMEMMQAMPLDAMGGGAGGPPGAARMMAPAPVAGPMAKFGKGGGPAGPGLPNGLQGKNAGGRNQAARQNMAPRGVKQNRIADQAPAGRFGGGGRGMPAMGAGGFGGPAGGLARPGAMPMAPGMPFADAKVEMMTQPQLPQVFPFVYREFAHQRPAELQGDLRGDFTETVYWHPVLVTPENGRATVNFQLSDSIATYQVLVAGHTTDGRIGAVTKTIEARKPFTVDPKLPLEINSGDVIDVPVRVVNDSDSNRVVSFTLEPRGLKAEGGSMITAEGLVKDSIQLQANEKGRKVFRVRPTGSGDAALIVKGNSEPTAEPDTVGRVIKVVPEGFPATGAVSDILEKQVGGVIEIPRDMVKNTLKVKLEVYPTTMSDLVKGLEGLLREPGGCFEQTSTSNYPNTLILDYLQTANQSNPEVSKRAKEMLDRGYAKLTAFECPDTPLKLRQGFEWFGGPDMAHEALTAYGLLQFKDMARVHPVDPVMIKRTQEFLLSRRDGKGGFLRNGRALDSFGNAPKHTTDAYITWALVESDPDNKEGLDLRKEIEALKIQAMAKDSRERKDSYFVALVANILMLRDDRDGAIALMKELQSRMTKEGSVAGAETSITFSQGRDLEIETTAMAMLGWIRSKDVSLAVAVKQSTKWVSQQRGGHGAFGSTQSTIMALKALIASAKASAHPAEAGEITLSIAGKRVAVRKFTQEDTESIGLDLENPESHFAPGQKVEILIETTAKQPYPFTFGYSYTTLTPVAADKAQLRLETKLAKVVAVEGEVVPLSIKVENKKDQGQGMSVAIIGLPAGMKVPTDMKQLTDLREKKVISYFELRGRELVLYWRNMAPNQKIDLSVDLVCDVPGEYRGPASRAYLYYSADHKHWIEPLTIKITPLAPADEKIAAK